MTKKTKVEKKDEKMEEMYMSLNPRQRRFIHEYLVDENATAAAIRAGYATKWANRQGHLLLLHPQIKSYIDYKTEARIEQIVSIDPDYVIQGLMNILNKDGAKDSDKIRIYELMAKHLGMLRDKLELTGRDGGAIEIEQRKIEEEAQSFTNLIRTLQDKGKDVIQIV